MLRNPLNWVYCAVLPFLECLHQDTTLKQTHNNSVLCLPSELLFFLSPSSCFSSSFSFSVAIKLK